MLDLRVRSRLHDRVVRCAATELELPSADQRGTRRSLDLDVTAVLRRALGRAGIVEVAENGTGRIRANTISAPYPRRGGRGRLD
jgi:hypothetical protein